MIALKMRSSFFLLETLIAAALLLGSFHYALGEQTAEIRGRLRLPDELKTQLNTTRLTLNDGEYYTYTRIDGSFVFYDVRPGIHLLDVQSTIFLYPQVKIQLLESSMDNPKCIEYAFPGAPKQAVPHPLVLTALAKFDYFERRQGFNIFMLLKNPMVLMMLVSAGLMLVMPKMMEGLDPEQQARFRQQMENQGDPAKMLSSMFQDLSDATGGGSSSSSSENNQEGVSQSTPASASQSPRVEGSGKAMGKARRGKRH